MRLKDLVQSFFFSRRCFALQRNYSAWQSVFLLRCYKPPSLALLQSALAYFLCVCGRRWGQASPCVKWHCEKPTIHLTWTGHRLIITNKSGVVFPCGLFQLYNLPGHIPWILLWSLCCVNKQTVCDHCSCSILHVCGGAVCFPSAPFLLVIAGFPPSLNGCRISPCMRCRGRRPSLKNPPLSKSLQRHVAVSQSSG